MLSLRLRKVFPRWSDLRSVTSRDVVLTIAVGLSALVLVLGVMFLAAIPVGVYADHQELVSAKNSLIEKNALLDRTVTDLKKYLAAKDQRIEELRTRLERKPPRVTAPSTMASASWNGLQPAVLADALRRIPVACQVQNSPSQEMIGNALRSTMRLAGWSTNDQDTIVDPSRFTFTGIKIITNEKPLSANDRSLKAANLLLSQLTNQNIHATVISSGTSFPENWIRVIIGDR